MITRNMHIAQGMPRARRAGGASAARNGHRGRVGGVSAASRGGGTELEAKAEARASWRRVTRSCKLAGAVELEAEEGELEGPVQHAMDTEDELEGSVQRSQRLARLRR